MTNDKSYVEIKEGLDRIRSINSKGIINEFADKGSQKQYDNSNTQGNDYGNVNRAVPYTMQDELMANITQAAKTQFGADFSQSNEPMLYYPEDGDVVLSGTISDMNDAKFQFRYKDSSGNGCYLWTSPFQLTDETLKKLRIINGVYKNWKDELSKMEDIKPLGMRNDQV